MVIEHTVAKTVVLQSVRLEAAVEQMRQVGEAVVLTASAVELSIQGGCRQQDEVVLRELEKPCQRLSQARQVRLHERMRRSV